MKAIIVDDEAKSRRMLKALCEEYCEGLEIVGLGASVTEARALVDEFQPDLVFLDIQMPVESGFKLLEYYQGKITFEVIFTTAYDQYAMQAFRSSAVDYLLKPIDIDELVHAVDQVRIIKGKSTNSERFEYLAEVLSSDKINKIALTTADGFTFVKFADIVRCEAEVNYTMFYLAEDSSLLITKTLKHFEDLLLDKNFFRVHKSHLINLNYVRRFIKGKQGMVEMTDGKMIEVSIRKRDALLERLAIV